MASNCQACDRTIRNDDFPYCDDCRFDDRTKLRVLYRTSGSWGEAERRLMRVNENEAEAAAQMRADFRSDIRSEQEEEIRRYTER